MSNINKKKDSPYKDCACFVEGNITCGPYKRWRKDGVLKVNEFTENLEKHLQTLKVIA